MIEATFSQSARMERHRQYNIGTSEFAGCDLLLHPLRQLLAKEACQRQLMAILECADQAIQRIVIAPQCKAAVKGGSLGAAGVAGLGRSLFRARCHGRRFERFSAARACRAGLGQIADAATAQDAIHRGAVDRGAVDHGAVDHGAIDRGAIDCGAT